MNRETEKWLRRNISIPGIVIVLCIIIYMIVSINVASAMYAGDNYTFSVNTTNN